MYKHHTCHYNAMQDRGVVAGGTLSLTKWTFRNSCTHGSKVMANEIICLLLSIVSTNKHSFCTINYSKQLPKSSIQSQLRVGQKIGQMLYLLQTLDGTDETLQVQTFHSTNF